MVSIHSQYDLSSGVGKGKGGLGTVNFNGSYINLISISQKQNTVRVNFTVQKLKVELFRASSSLLFDIYEVDLLREIHIP